MNGGAGDRFWVRVPTLVTIGCSSRIAATCASGVASSRDRRARRRRSARARPRSVSPAAVARRASIVQYSRAVNAVISRSRSTTSRTATDWTRPADRPPRTLRDEQRAQRVADQAVDDAARLLRVDEVHVDLARVRERLADRRLGDLVEGDPLRLARPGRGPPRRRARRSPRPRGRGRWRGRPGRTPLAAFSMSETCLRRSSEITYSGAKSWSTSTPNLPLPGFSGRSRTWPYDARTR